MEIDREISKKAGMISAAVAALRRHDMHMRMPDVDADTYVRILKLDAYDSVANKHKIYLDTNYWVKMCNAYLKCGRYTEDDVELLAMCNEAASSGKVIFPMSNDIFMEVMKQLDDTTRIATARIIDFLSGGICLLNLEERWNTERMALIRNMFWGESISPVERIWGRAGSVLGVRIPTMERNMDPAKKNAMLKGAVDTVWLCSYETIIAALNASTWPSRKEDLDKLNRIKKETILPKSIYKLQDEYIYSLMGAYRDNLVFYIQELLGKGIDISEEAFKHTLSEKSLTDGGIQIAPTPYIYSALCALTVWNKTRVVKENDGYDLNHALGGLAYCDAMFSERSLCHDITSGPFKLDRKMNCTVMWKTCDSLEYIRSLI